MKSNTLEKPGPAPIESIIAGKLGEAPLCDSPESSDEGKPFPLSAFPRALEIMAQNVAACLQLPISLVAICIIGCVSAAIGKGLVVESRRGRFTRANIYLLGSAASGSGKSEATRMTMAPIVRAEKRVRDKFAEEVRPRLLAELESLKTQLKPASTENAADDAMRAAAFRRMEEITPILAMPQLIANNSTTEKLARSLERNNETMFSVSGEARDILKNVLGKYTKGKGDTDEGIYLAGYTGDPVRIQRVHNGDTVLESPCITALWLVQPDLVARVIDSDSLTEGGLLPRFNIAHTNAKRQRRTGEEPEFNPMMAAEYDNIVESLVETYRLSGVEPYVIQADKDVSEMMRDFHNSTITEDGRYGDVEPYVSRWEENAWRLAVILHCAEYGRGAHEKPLRGDIAARAIEIQKWFIEEQLALLSAGRAKKRDDQKTHVFDVISRKFAADKKYVSERVIQQTTGMNKDQVRGIVAELVASSLVEEVIQKPATGPSFKTYAPK